MRVSMSVTTHDYANLSSGVPTSAKRGETTTSDVHMFPLRTTLCYIWFGLKQARVALIRRAHVKRWVSDESAQGTERGGRRGDTKHRRSCRAVCDARGAPPHIDPTLSLTKYQCCLVSLTDTWYLVCFTSRYIGASSN